MPPADKREFSSQTEYRRRARKIRATFVDQPLLRHRALTELAMATNQMTFVPARLNRSKEQVPTTLPAAFRLVARRTVGASMKASKGSVGLPGETQLASERAFCDEVYRTLSEGVFTYSDRVRLLEHAERSGIQRFRANLILAMEQHRLGVATNAGASNDAARTGAVKPGFSVIHLLLILAIEVLICGVFVWAV